MVSGLRPLAVCSRRIKPCQYRRYGGMAAREVRMAQGGAAQCEQDMLPASLRALNEPRSSAPD